MTFLQHTPRQRGRGPFGMDSPRRTHPWARTCPPDGPPPTASSRPAHVPGPCVPASRVPAARWRPLTGRTQALEAVDSVHALPAVHAGVALALVHLQLAVHALETCSDRPHAAQGGTRAFRPSARGREALYTLGRHGRFRRRRSGPGHDGRQRLSGQTGDTLGQPCHCGGGGGHLRRQGGTWHADEGCPRSLTGPGSALRTAPGPRDPAPCS